MGILGRLPLIQVLGANATIDERDIQTRSTRSRDLCLLLGSRLLRSLRLKR